MPRRVIALVVIACGLWGLACGGARMVRSEPNGGVVAIRSNGDQDSREKAWAMMAEKCPNGFVVDREEEVQDGIDASANANYGRYRVNSTQNTRADTEWHIIFHCK